MKKGKIAFSIILLMVVLLFIIFSGYLIYNLLGGGVYVKNCGIVDETEDVSSCEIYKPNLYLCAFKNSTPNDLGCSTDAVMPGSYYCDIPLEIEVPLNCMYVESNPSYSCTHSYFDDVSREYKKKKNENAFNCLYEYSLKCDKAELLIIEESKLGIDIKEKTKVRIDELDENICVIHFEIIDSANNIFKGIIGECRVPMSEIEIFWDKLDVENYCSGELVKYLQS